MAGSASIVVTATGTLTAALDDVVHAKQPKARRRRLKWREYENLPEEAQVDESNRSEYTGPSVLADTTEQALAFESQRLVGLLAAAKIEQENAKQRAAAAEHARHVKAARAAVAEMIAAAQEADRLAQEIEEIDVAYIVATLLND
jgi:hypothetical protein